MQTNRNHGAYLLARLEKTQNDVADRIGVSRPAVEHWLSGERKPGAKYRLALLRAYRIPVHAWDEPVPKREPKKQPPRELVDERPSAPPAEDAAVRERALRLAHDVDQLRQEAFDDHESTPLERAKVLSSCAQTLKLIGTLTGETLEIGETRVLRLAAWRRIQEAIKRVLTPWPDAMRLLGEELKRLGSEW